MQDKLLRSRAETENVRRRGEEELKKSADFAITNFATALLEVADSLNMAVQNLPEHPPAGVDPGAYGSLRDGVALTQRQLTKVLERFHVQRYESLGEKFDPALHNVVFTLDEEGADGTIAKVLKEGYKLKDRVIRAAVVGTIKRAKPATPPPTDQAM